MMRRDHDRRLGRPRRWQEQLDRSGRARPGRSMRGRGRYPSLHVVADTARGVPRDPLAARSRRRAERVARLAARCVEGARPRHRRDRPCHSSRGAPRAVGRRPARRQKGSALCGSTRRGTATHRHPSPSSRHTSTGSRASGRRSSRTVMTVRCSAHPSTPRLAGGFRPPFDLHSTRSSPRPTRAFSRRWRSARSSRRARRSLVSRWS